MKKKLILSNVALLTAFILISACGSESADNPNRSGNSPIGGNDASAKVDIIFVNAIGGENSNLSQKHKIYLESLLSLIRNKMSAYSGMNLALIASPTGAVSGVPLSLNPFAGFGADRIKQINFEIATKDLFLGTIVTGCPAGMTDLEEDQHAAGSVKVCNKKLNVPPHSWTWANQDLPGTLHGFLRSGAKRVYVFVSSGDSTIVSPAEFLELAKAQNNGIAPKVYAISPASISGDCNSQNTVAQNIGSLVGMTGGANFSYCDQNWNNHILQISSGL